MNHYQTLKLPSPPYTSTGPPTNSEIKQAYRLALLAHHPDKRSKGEDALLAELASAATTTPASASTVSIDAIKTAYTTLSSPHLRSTYDRDLLLNQRSPQTPRETGKTHHTGEELVDLDDLDYDELEGIWCRSCRCGEKRGYVVTEAQLEEEEGKGGREVVVGCKGCSLWIKVGFGVVDDEDKEKGMSLE